MADSVGMGTPYTSRDQDQVVTQDSPFKLWTRTIDFVKAKAAKGSALVQNDTIDVFQLPAGTRIYDCWTRIQVAATASTTMTLGDVASATGFVVSVALDAAAQTQVCGNGAYLVSNATPIITVVPKFYSTATVLRAVLNSSATPLVGAVEVNLLTIAPTVSITNK
jgi:hypothetical protein